MKGKLGYDRWHVGSTGGQSYIAERILDDNHETKYVNAHCLACAKSEVLARYGGKVDLRGWHRAGTCGFFLLAMQSGTDNEKEEEENE